MFFMKCPSSPMMLPGRWRLNVVSWPKFLMRLSRSSWFAMRSVSPALSPGFEENSKECECEGSVLWFSVKLLPCFCPIFVFGSSGLLPKDASALPLRSGSAKFVLPLPPYVVPKSEKSAWLLLMERRLPSANAYPPGAKFPPNMSISPITVWFSILVVLPVYAPWSATM